MNAPQLPHGERRRARRYSPDNVLVRVGSGVFEEKNTAVNFAVKLLNVSLRGMCVQTAGRLRSGVKMVAEVRFSDLAATIRSDTRVVWVDTEDQGGKEIHRAGLVFVGNVQIAKPVREYLLGADREMIQSKREMEYAQLKRNAEVRKDKAGKKGGFFKKAIAALFILAILYAGSFWVFAFLGRAETTGAEITFRYLPSSSGDSTMERALAKFYSPAYWLFRKAGADLRYEPE